MSNLSFIEKLLGLSAEQAGGVEVEWKALGEVCDFKNGFAFKSSLFKAAGLPIVRITNVDGKNINLSDVKYFDPSDYKENTASYEVKKNDILIAMSGATTGKIGFYDHEAPAYLNQRVGKFLPKQEALNNRYLYHYLLSKVEDIYVIAGGGAQPNLSSNALMAKIQIPIPCPDNSKKSLEIQAEIVRILDAFTAMTAELTAELSLRKKQYNHYRDQLLSFPCAGVGTQGEARRPDRQTGLPADRRVEWKTLGEVAVIGTGRHDTQDAIEDGDYIFYARGREPLKLNVFDFDETAIITAGDGAGVGKVFHYAQGKYALHQRAYRIVSFLGRLWSRGLYITIYQRSFTHTYKKLQ